jgi:hypothetical protein
MHRERSISRIVFGLGSASIVASCGVDYVGLAPTSSDAGPERPEASGSDHEREPARFDASGIGSNSAGHDVRSASGDASAAVDVDTPAPDTSTLWNLEAGSPAQAESDDGSLVDEGGDGDTSSIDALPGATCGAPGTTDRCAGSQVCCATLAAQKNACTASCAANQTLACSVPSDCPASAPVCCAQMALTGTLPPCPVTAFSSFCAASCADSPPAGCPYTGLIRLCAHDEDCASETTNNLCFTFNNAPTSWCANSSTAALGGGVERK